LIFGRFDAAAICHGRRAGAHQHRIAPNADVPSRICNGLASNVNLDRHA
jgi:hypothetical protein